MGQLDVSPLRLSQKQCDSRWGSTRTAEWRLSPTTKVRRCPGRRFVGDINVEEDDYRWLINVDKQKS
jgi:hypothetical protein